MESLRLFAEQLLTPGATGNHFFFNTPAFILCFTGFYAIYLLVAQHWAGRAAALVGFSFFFYWQFGGPWVLLLTATAAVDWAVARQLPRANASLRGLLLTLSVGINLGVLAWFKYRGFLLGGWAELAAGGTPDALRLLAPVGLSYTSFKSLSYLFDVRDETIDQPERSYLAYLAYVSFFPNLLAGPIHRAVDWLPQLRERFQLTSEQLGRAVFWFLAGLFKKTVIADPLAADYLNRIFDAPDRYSGFEVLMAAYGYGVHLFCDFSGYTDMALAVALLLGFDLAANFNEPFKARNVGEFWRRWHITLSTWFQDYVFTPLSYGWRSWGRWGAVLAVLVTFLLSGLWHGAGWTFILWGASHGAAIAWETATRESRKSVRARLPARLYDGLSLLLTFQFLSLTYILFRAASLEQTGRLYLRLLIDFDLSLAPAWAAAYPRVLALIVLGLTLHFLPLRWKQNLGAAFGRLHWTLQAVVCVLVVLLAYQVQSAEPLPFVYLQF